ncbi:RNA methyltransferase [Flavobacteriaceae bacterium R38]|nr:RNA methyltransferase [Flavobacteriaceae bacterium R38]
MNKFVLEGLREIKLALKSDYQIEIILFDEHLLTDKALNQLNEITTTPFQIIKITREIYQKIAYRETTEGIMAIGVAKKHALNTIKLKRKNPLILVAEAPEKPGNIGALLRTADAANLDAVIIANPKTDLYNPNIIRSSVGCIFTNQIVTGTSTEIIQFLKDQEIQIYCMALTASVNYHTIDFHEATAIVVGTEASGLNKEWLENSTQNIIIPMQGEIDSMNVSVSAAIAIFEAKRQRNFN